MTDGELVGATESDINLDMLPDEQSERVASDFNSVNSWLET